MDEQAMSFFDYPYSAFRDESDFAGLFIYAGGLLRMHNARQGPLSIVCRAFARGGIADEHWPIFVRTIELRLEEFGRLGELPDWLRLLKYHTEPRSESDLSDVRALPQGITYRKVPDAVRPVPPVAAWADKQPGVNGRPQADPANPTVPRRYQRQVAKLWPEPSIEGKPSVTADDVAQQVRDGQRMRLEQPVEKSPCPPRQKTITTIQSSRFFGRDGPLGSAEDLAARLAIRGGSGTQAGILRRLTRGYGGQGNNGLDDSLREKIIDLLFSLHPDDDVKAKHWVRVLTKEFPPRKSTPSYLIA